MILIDFKFLRVYLEVLIKIPPRGTIEIFNLLYVV